MQEILFPADEKSMWLWRGLSLGYPEPRGNPILKEEISKLYGSEISAFNVLCFAGAQEGIYCTMRMLLLSGDHVIIVTPCYRSLLSMPASITGDVSQVLLSPDENWDLDPMGVIEAMNPNAKMIILNFPHTPTALYSKNGICKRF